MLHDFVVVVSLCVMALMCSPICALRLLPGKPGGQLTVSDLLLDNFYHPDDATEPSLGGSFRFQPNVEDPRFPFAVHKEQKCIAAMLPNVPAVVYVRNGTNGMHYSALWESQYLQDLLRGVSANMTLCEVSNWESDLKSILHHGEEITSRIGIIFNSNEVKPRRLARFMQSLRAQKPTLLISLADEYGHHSPGDAYDRIVGEDGLVLRQYYFAKYHLPPRPRVLTIPLGYASGAPFNANSCEASKSAQQITERDYTWSFVGTVYEHRQKMIDILSSGVRFRKHFVGITSAEDMLEIYKKSTFVPVGRGHVNLDCFRIYEALISGAIPVVVGREEEINSTFAEHHNMPMVVANSWKAAANQMSRLLGSPPELRVLQRSTASWVCETMRNLRAQIAAQLEPTMS